MKKQDVRRHLSLSSPIVPDVPTVISSPPPPAKLADPVIDGFVTASVILVCDAQVIRLRPPWGAVPGTDGSFETGAEPSFYSPLVVWCGRDVLSSGHE